MNEEKIDMLPVTSSDTYVRTTELLVFDPISNKNWPIMLLFLPIVLLCCTAAAVLINFVFVEWLYNYSIQNGDCSIRIY